MQSLESKIFMGILRMVFHSPLSDSSRLTDDVSKAVKDKKSRYRPSKDFIYSKHAHDTGMLFYEGNSILR